MLDIYKNSKKKATTAVIKGSETDAIMSISKKLGLCPCMIAYEPGNEILCLDKAVMKNSYSGTVKCDERDTFDEAVGVDQAVKKAMDNHKRGFTKAIIRWQAAMIKKVMEVSPETFNDALKKVHKCDCCNK